MHFSIMGVAFDFFDTLGLAMVGISVLAILASARLAKWTHRLAECNRLHRQLMQVRRAQLRQNHLLFYKNMDSRQHCLRSCA